MLEKPAKEIQAGMVRALIWAGNGGKGVEYTITFHKLRKVNGVWKMSSKFGRHDLPLVAKAADLAHAWFYACAEHGKRTAAGKSGPKPGRASPNGR
jgi:hypothetical protein